MLTDTTVFGKQSRPRCMDPSMKEILSWKSEALQLKTLQQPDRPERLYSQLIKKSNDPHGTQNRQEFTKFYFDQATKTYQPIFNQDLLNRIIKRTSPPRHQPLSQTQDDFARVKIQDQNQLHLLIKANASHSRKSPPKIENSVEKKQIQETKQQDKKNSPAKPKQKSKKSKTKTRGHQSVQALQHTKRQKRIKEFERETRWLPNSSFKSYFGKPPFEAYGLNNTSTPGGLLYGDYLKTHNVMPHAGQNQPKFNQTYKSAIIHAKPVDSSLPRKFAEQPAIVNELPLTESKIFPQASRVKPIEMSRPDLRQASVFSTKRPQPQKRRPLQERSQGKHTQNEAPAPQQPRPTKLDKKQAKKENVVDGLKFMNQRKKFIEQLLAKKAHSQRIADKVTQVIQQPEYHPPSQLNLLEKDPKNYKHAESRWLQRIPRAGQQSKQNQGVKSLI